MPFERAPHVAACAMEEDPPEAVLMWNVIAEHKVLLADGLLDVPLFDVSPGEMYFASLRRSLCRCRSARVSSSR